MRTRAEAFLKAMRAGGSSEELLDIIRVNLEAMGIVFDKDRWAMASMEERAAIIRVALKTVLESNDR
ncbi:hypothetical protein SLNSH_22700 [Alsobacter soli]|uniref:Uncharacterized protein n=1 Tax=Alsobacter soli TaxID=2109933 RepID=A0A2T1HLZ1_9HYPH|nr:hypothetical protein [Alsobacter soli]PSC02675.1 hypothetical protein SLNSH_22700 [Alsobacter soli]